MKANVDKKCTHKWNTNWLSRRDWNIYGAAWENLLLLLEDFFEVQDGMPVWYIQVALPALGPVIPPLPVPLPSRPAGAPATQHGCRCTKAQEGRRPPSNNTSRPSPSARLPLLPSSQPRIALHYSRNNTHRDGNRTTQKDNNIHDTEVRAYQGRQIGLLVAGYAGKQRYSCQWSRSDNSLLTARPCLIIRRVIK